MCAPLMLLLRDELFVGRAWEEKEWFLAVA
jgi:hypothetical protein